MCTRRAQFRSVVALLLVAAVVIAALTAEVADAVAIAAVLALNVILGFAVEMRARRAVEALGVSRRAARRSFTRDCPERLTRATSFQATLFSSNIMSQPVLACGPETTLAAAACLMRDADCGALPVVDADGRISGIITDRDVCLAVGASHRNARYIRVHEAMTSKVATIGALAEIGEALSAMKRARVRRLPVVDENRRPIGLLSIDDVAVRGLDADAISSAAIALTLRSLCERRPAEIDSEIQHMGV